MSASGECILSKKCILYKCVHHLQVIDNWCGCSGPFSLMSRPMTPCGPDTISHLPAASVGLSVISLGCLTAAHPFTRCSDFG